MTNAVLTSGVALGTHVPGLLINEAFLARGVASRVHVLEALFTDDVRQRIQTAKTRYSRSFRMAKAAHAMASDQSELIPAEAAEGLFAEWDESGVRSIVVLSGFWIGTVRAYVDRRPGVLVDTCHLDAIPSPSHRRAAEVPGSTHSWLLDAQRNSLNEGIPIGGDGVQLPWTSRSIGFLAHGGGWGMGTHADAALELAGAGEDVSLILTEPRPAPAYGLSVFHQDPEWEAWSDAGFPRLAADRGRAAGPFENRERWPDAFELTRRSRAVVSKPGAGTLVDSLNAATPVLFTEALGGWELANQRVWTALGFGMPLAEWLCQRDPAVLEAMHQRLRVAGGRTASYPDRLVSRGYGRRANQ